MMTVTVHEKKEFIRNFLNKYQMQKRESVWILNYIISHDRLLEKLHFVRELTPEMMKTTIAFKMSTYCSDAHPLEGFMNNRRYTDAEKMFHAVRLARDEDIYIQLNFYESKTNPHYMNVIEEQPITDKELEEFSADAVAFLEHCTADFQKRVLLKQIDIALDKGQKKKFLKLSEEYRRLTS